MDYIEYRIKQIDREKYLWELGIEKYIEYF